MMYKVMEEKLFGIPLVVLGGICLALTVVWVFVWPGDKATSLTGLRFFILRWFHALVWLLLAIAAFMAAFHAPGGAPAIRVVALLSLIVYLVFMFVFITSR